MVLTLFFAKMVFAQADKETEVNYLLQFIADSECVFVRNGSEYDSQQARKHIEKKYDYLKARLDSTEAFIRQAASVSSFSGRPYMVVCKGGRQSSESWLMAALQDYRTGR